MRFGWTGIAFVLTAAAGSILAGEDATPAASVVPIPAAAEALPPSHLLSPGQAEVLGPLAGFDSKSGGFFLRSEDGNFQINIGAKLQARYTYFGKDEHQDDSGHDESYFELERARIGLSGHLFDPSLKFKIEIESDNDAGDKGVLTDTYIQYAPGKAFAVGVGQFKPAFLRLEYTSSFKQQMVERSLANEFFNIDRNVGIWVAGEPSKWFYYNLALTNGIDTVNTATGGGASTFNLNQPPAFVGKIDFTMMGDHKYSYEGGDLKRIESPLLVVGGSFVAQDFNRAGGSPTSFIATEGDLYSFGLDAIFKYRGLSVMGEYVGRWYDQDGDGSGSSYAHGFTVQGGAFVSRSPDIELTIMFSAVYGNEGPRAGTGYQFGPGINWYIFKNHNVKLQADVSYVDIDNDLPSQTELLRQGPSRTFTTTPAGFSAGEQGVLTRVQMQVVF